MEEGEKMREQMREAGVRVKEKRMTKAQREAEEKRLKKAEISVRNAESAAKNTQFAMDGAAARVRDESRGRRAGGIAPVRSSPRERRTSRLGRPRG